MKRHAHTPERYPTKEVTVSDLTTVELLWLEKAHREPHSVWSLRRGKDRGPQSTRPVFRSRQHLRFRTLDVQRLWDGPIPYRYPAGGDTGSALFDSALDQ